MEIGQQIHRVSLNYHITIEILVLVAAATRIAVNAAALAAEVEVDVVLQAKPVIRLSA